MRVAVLFGLVAGLSLVGGCKKTPTFISDIGDAIDRGTKNVVDGTRRVFTGEKRPPRELPEVEEEVAEDEAYVAARKAYDEGKLAYQMADYIEAVDKFKESFAAADGIEDQDTRAQVQSTLYFNLGQGQLHAFEIDEDRDRLVKAKSLLNKHLESAPGLADEDRAYAEALIADADALLNGEELEGADEVPVDEADSEGPAMDAPDDRPEAESGAADAADEATLEG